MITIDEVADLAIRLNSLLAQSHEENRQLKSQVDGLNKTIVHLQKELVECNNVREPDKPKNAKENKEGD